MQIQETDPRKIPKVPGYLSANDKPIALSRYLMKSVEAPDAIKGLHEFSGKHQLYPIGYTHFVLEIRKTGTFSEWLDDLTDLTGRSRILMRIERLRGGNFGD